MLTAALDLFGTDGYRATSIEKLCASAGISTRNFYEEFRGREDILIAVYDEVMTGAAKATAGALAGAMELPTPERVDRSIRAFLDHVFGDPKRARIAFVEMLGVSPAVEEHRLGWRRRRAATIEATVRAAVDAGEAPDRDYSLAAIAFIGAFNELVYDWALNGTNVPVDALIEEITRMVNALIFEG
ncbi:TetR/AcrR family transcriptional regulator [Pseudonocardia sp. TRM90224]|uniref:TetR/AcrR family transcriptional regulator n=1 Tax=Pseudonocardia sp. TRM90224 TaxID=2812678 RepID=UPI001E310BDC|nr:TetR/AcrR family transcriptional regulator [Pseudonocardia sp. TRM90224]